MLQPSQFRVNEAWLAFRILELPTATSEGEVFTVALMDAASRVVLGVTLVAAVDEQPSVLEARRLMVEAERHARWQLPTTLYLPSDYPGDHFVREAEQRKIAVVRIPEDQLLLIIGELRTSAKKRLAGRIPGTPDGKIDGGESGCLP